MTTIQVPRTAKSIQSDLKSLWLTENEVQWSRSALVFAWADLALDDPGVLTLKDAYRRLAALKVQGIGASVTKVQSYYEAWQKAIEIGIAAPAVAGAPLDLPTDNFETYWANTPKAKQDSRRREGTSGVKPTAKPLARPKGGVESKPSPRVATVRERGERIVQELRAQVKQEQDVGRKAIWEATLSVALNALNSYTKANA